MNALIKTRRGIWGALSCSTHADPLITECLSVEPSRVPTLQETEQVILHYAKCNRMIKQQENPFPKVVRKGMICGYHETSGGPCKVS